MTQIATVISRCLLAYTLFLPLSLVAQDERCTYWIATLESYEGSVRWRSHEGSDWAIASVGEGFCIGDHIVVHDGRAILRLSNDTLVKLSQNTSIRMHEKNKSLWVHLLEGASYFLSRTKNSFQVKAPYINASVDGTEFSVSHLNDKSEVAVFEGAVTTSDSAKQFRLSSGEGIHRGPNIAASRKIKIQLPDAVAWGLNYPPLVVQVKIPQSMQHSILIENTSAALAEFDRLNPNEYDARLLAFVASLSLQAGQLDLAEQYLSQAIDRDAQQIESIGLLAMIDLVKGDLENAVKRIETIKDSQNNITYLNAQSYIDQAHGDHLLALHHSQQALALAPDNPVLLARTIELLMINQNDHEAKSLIQSAKAEKLLGNELLSLSGYIELRARRIDRAIDYFSRAMKVDTNNPKVWLGLGLAYIHGGQLELGRKSIETAVVLDPNNSVLRSYLGKSYFEEGRHIDANAQYQLAQQIDGNDPTAYFYQAQLYRSQNQFPKAVQLLESAIEKNDNRAVYRSRFLLDSDIASRSADQSQLLQAIGFDQRAKNLAKSAIHSSPGDYSGHRSLATALSVSPRNENNRASQTLQATILQPLGVKGLPPGMTGERINALVPVGPVKMGINEYNPLYFKKGLSGTVSGLKATQDMYSLEWQGQWLGEGAAVTVGQYKYSDEVNNKGKNVDFGVSDMLVQLQPHSTLQLQAQVSEINNLDEQTSTDLTPTKLDSKTTDYNLRANWEFLSGQFVLIDLLDRNYIYDEFKSTFSPFPTELVTDGKDKYTKQEINYKFGSKILDISLGYYDVELHSKKEFVASISFTPFSPPQIFPGSEETQDKISKLYGDIRVNLPNQLAILEAGVARIDDSNQRIAESLLPSFGVRVPFLTNWSASLGYWEDVQEFRVPYLSNTNVLAFTREEDGALWSNSKTSGFMVDYASVKYSFMFEVKDIKTDRYSRNAETSGQLYIPFQELQYVTEFNIIVSESSAVSVGYLWEKASELDPVRSESSSPVYTARVPVSYTYAFKNGMNVRLQANYIDQNNRKYIRQGEENKRDQFTNLDVLLSWILPWKHSELSVGMLNLFDQDVTYRKGSITVLGEDLGSELQEFSPERRGFLKLSVDL